MFFTCLLFKISLITLLLTFDDVEIITKSIWSKIASISLKKLTEEIETARKNYGTEESENE